MKALLGILAGIVVVYLMFTFGSVGTGERGVQTRFGKVQEEVLGEGIHYVGVFTNIHEMPIKTQKVELKADAASKDLQSVMTQVAVNIALDPTKVKEVYQTVGDEDAYKEVLVAPAIEESVKSATARFTAEEMISKREEVKAAIVAELRDRLESRFIKVEDVLITNFAFSDEFNRAIENKQSAEQNALKAARDLDRVKLEAQQKIEQAKAEAESLKIQKQEISAEMLQLRWIEKWNGQVPTYWGNVTPFVGLQK